MNDKLIEPKKRKRPRWDLVRHKKQLGGMARQSTMLPRARDMGMQGYRHKLEESIYIWNDRPGWDYAGMPRVVLGRAIDPRQFSIKTESIAGQIWRFEDQCWAVEQGFFVQREIIRERAVIVGITDPFDVTFSYWRPYQAMQEIERRYFQRRPGYDRLLNFIRQQDLYGYTGAWDRRIQNYTPELAWYKLYVKSLGGMNKRLEKLRRTAARARDHKHAKRVANIIMSDNPRHKP